MLCCKSKASKTGVIMGACLAKSDFKASAVITKQTTSSFAFTLQISGSQKKSQTNSNLNVRFVEIHWPNGILKWPCHHMPKAGQLLAQEELGVREKSTSPFFATSWTGISRKCTLDLPVGNWPCRA